MALPTTVVAQGNDAGHHPPFKSSAGNFYVVAMNSVDDLIVMRATDPTDSWTESDALNNPSGQTTTVYSAIQQGDLLHIASYRDNVEDYVYSQFDMAGNSDAGLWGTGSDKEQTIEAPTNAPTNPWISIAVRSDGDVVVVYAGDTDAVMGGDKERVDVNVRTSGTWGGPTALGDTGGTDPFDTTDVHYGNPNCVKASDSDDVHIIYAFTGNTADPPTTWTHGCVRTLDSADSLSTQVNSSAVGVDIGTALNGRQNGVSFDNAGSQVTRFCAARAPSSSGLGVVDMLEEDGSGDMSFESTASQRWAEVTAEVKVNGEVGICTLVNLGPDLHILWSNGDDTDDIWYVSSTDTGDTWSTEAQELDAVACNFISANIYQRGDQLVLAYVYDDGGTTKYNEKNLTTPSMTNLDDATLTGLVNSHVGPFEI